MDAPSGSKAEMGRKKSFFPSGLAGSIPAADQSPATALFPASSLSSLPAAEQPARTGNPANLNKIHGFASAVRP
jgi:hypothetical protein